MCPYTSKMEKDIYGVFWGGYNSHVQLPESHCFKMPNGCNVETVAPLMCAGVTMYKPLARYGKKGMRCAIIGMGGLGHMGLKFGKAFGAEVTLFTTSPAKADDARRLGADNVVISTDRDEMRKVARSLDFILDTVSTPHDLGALLNCLAADGTLCLVGMPGEPAAVSAGSLVSLRRRLVGSLIGGIAETQEMLDFCAAQGVTSDIEAIEPGQVNEAYGRLRRADVRYRFVLDMSTL